MREFFQGWRRKAGLVTLAMACLLTVGWMRSRVYSDSITLYHDDRASDFLVSFQGGIKWVATSQGRAGPLPVPPRFSFSGTFVAGSDAVLQPVFSGIVPTWRWQWRGFGFVCGEAEVFGYEVSVWTIPYWSLVLPLTLLSAWLILGRR